MSNKQIDEMCEVLRQNYESCKTCRWYEAGLCLDNCELSEDNQIVCEALFNAGYRKATDVAEEIFEVIEDKLTDKIQYWMEKAEGIKGQYEAGYLYERISTIEDLLNLLGEIKDKYTEEKE